MDNRFYQYVELVVDNLEGGYFHPNHLNAPNVSDTTKQVYANSGETMYGMDRQAGAGLFKSGAGKEFWDTIDAQDAKNKWPWFYLPPKDGELAKKLKRLVAEIQYKQFCKLADAYLTDAETRKLVESSPRLMVHFFYACWNGNGYFQKFAAKITEAVKSGITDTTELAQIAMDHRRNYFSSSSTWHKQFNDGANKMESKIWPQLPAEPKAETPSKSRKTPNKIADKDSGKPVWPWIVGGALLLAGGIWWICKK